MTPSVNIHASCVRFGRQGVLLLGKSGAGKSDLALRLIARGARLVSDDRCVLCVVNGRLVAQPPPAIAGLLEVRGVGIVKMPHAAGAAIELVADLSARVERLPEPARYAPPKPLALRQSAQPKLIALNAFETSTPDKIALLLGALRQSAKSRAVKRN